MALRAVPVVADGLALLLLLFWLRPLAARLQDQSSLNVVWLGGAYILLCLGVYVIRKLEPAPAAPALTRPAPRIRGALGLLFGLVMMTAVAWQLGYFDVALAFDPIELGEGEAASFFVFAPSAWLGLSLFYVIILAFNVRPTVSRGDGNYPWLALAGVLGAHTMLLVATAQLRAIAATDVIANGRLLGLAAAFLTLLLLFGPPRLLYLSRQPRLSAAATFLVLLAYCAWQISA